MTDAERHELAEAEALAQALERDAALPELPADALQTAAFLRFNAKDADLGDVAEQRIFTELSDAVQRTPQRKPLRTWLWFVPAATLGAASLLFFMRTQQTPSSLTSDGTSLPRATIASPATEALTAPSQALASTLPKPSAKLIGMLTARLERNSHDKNGDVSADFKLWTHEVNQYRAELAQTLDPKYAKATLDAHNLAQTATNDEQRRAAATALETLVASLKTIGTPSSALLAQDAMCEYALLFLDLGRNIEGLARAEHGIEISATPSIFLANLHVTTAEAHERLERYDDAAEAYYQALQVNQQLMQDSLGK